MKKYAINTTTLIFLLCTTNGNAQEEVNPNTRLARIKAFFARCATRLERVIDRFSSPEQRPSNSHTFHQNDTTPLLGDSFFWYDEGRKRKKQ